MAVESNPLVSCIMPTCDRRAFVPRAIAYFLRQHYPHKRLTIIDDGIDAVGDLVPDDPHISYVRLPRRLSIGAKRNIACEQSAGAALIAHWDDDDWHAPHRLTYQIDGLLRAGGDICGLRTVLYLDARDGQAWKYSLPAGQRPWLAGNSLVYTRDFWASHRFAEVSVGEDSRFVYSADARRLVSLPDHTFHVGIIHPNNVSPKPTSGAWWKPHPAEDIRRLLGDDWTACRQPAQTIAATPAIAPPPRVSARVRNIFACLVHENIECIIDLVRNLRSLDPGSVVLLYNGSANPRLLETFPFARHGVVIHPSPKPMAWGTLHDFAIDCMQFALDQFTFDTLTIVDSDQLAVRAGYSEHIAAALANQPNVGMLGNSPSRQMAGTTIPPAKVAFAEIDLWRPLLARFKDGEDKFVHWSFWPSTVFTQAATRDLVSFFRGDEQFVDILTRSKIWATEEVILPTLIALLGYEIAANPCSYDFVKYRVPYTTRQMETALSRSDVLWVHPVPRKYDDALRRQVRDRHGHYPRVAPKESRPDPSVPLPPLLLTRPILARMRAIEGWLDEDEADLLIAATDRALADMPEARALVEIGSYCGRATIVLAGVVQVLRPTAKVWAIDPHDGRIGASDRIVLVAPSLEKLRRNLAAAGLENLVTVVPLHATDVSWEQPIAVLLIDGLHDYASVARDFYHFEPYLAPGACVAFHDYASYFPGVVTFVDELVATQGYRAQRQVKSMITLTGPNNSAAK